MFAHWIITAVVMVLFGIVLYKVAMRFIKKRKSLKAAFDEKEFQNLQSRLNDLKRRREEVKALGKSIVVTEQLVKLEKEIKILTKQITKIDEKRRNVK
jgi:uncharacterized membrane-anchored protein YhcB (DUF1043 family)